MSAPQPHPYQAHESDFLQGVAFRAGATGHATPCDPHACLNGNAAQLLAAHLNGMNGITNVAVVKDFPEHGWPKDAPFTQSAQVPFLDITMKGSGEVIHVNAGEIQELYLRYETPLADYIVMQRCLRAIG